MLILPYAAKYRDDMIFMVLQAKDPLGRIPSINEDLLDIESNYLARGDMFWITLNEQDRVIGCIGYSRTDNPDEAFLHRLYVKASEKHKGIGSALLRAAEDAMRKQGIRTALVHLGAPKEQWFESYAFYPKHGYGEYAPRYMRQGICAKTCNKSFHKFIIHEDKRMALILEYGKDDQNRKLRTAFDSDAANYDAIRPRYCAELFQKIVEAAALQPGMTCLEIGPGTGQATEPILATGCCVTAVELGKHLADYLADKYAQNENLTVWQGDFLSYPEERQFDLIFSATAFHWIPREEGLAKVKRLLKPGGVLALFWNHPLPGGGVDTPGDVALQNVYRKYGQGRRDTPFDGSSCPAYCDALRAAGFEDVRFELLESWRYLDGEHYVMLLRSYSDHAKMTQEEQMVFERDMRSAIDSIGGELPIRDLMDLYFARNP